MKRLNWTNFEALPFTECMCCTRCVMSCLHRTTQWHPRGSSEFTLLVASHGKCTPLCTTILCLWWGERIMPRSVNASWSLHNACPLKLNPNLLRRHDCGIPSHRHVTCTTCCLSLRGDVCPARYFSINYPDFSPRFTLSWISPPTFSKAQKRAEMLRHPCILGDPPRKGDKIRIGCLNPAFSGVPNKGDKIRSQNLR